MKGEFEHFGVVVPFKYIRHLFTTHNSWGSWKFGIIFQLSRHNLILYHVE